MDVVRFTRHAYGTGNTRSRWDEPTPVYPGASGVVVIDYGDSVCVEVTCVDPYNSVLADVPKVEVEPVARGSSLWWGGR